MIYKPQSTAGRTAGSIPRVNSAPATREEVLRHRPAADIHEQNKGDLIYRGRQAEAGNVLDARPVALLDHFTIPNKWDAYIIKRESPDAQTLGEGPLKRGHQATPNPEWRVVFRLPATLITSMAERMRDYADEFVQLVKLLAEFDVGPCNRLDNLTANYVHVDDADPLTWNVVGAASLGGDSQTISVAENYNKDQSTVERRAWYSGAPVANMNLIVVGIGAVTPHTDSPGVCDYVRLKSLRLIWET